MAKVIVVESGAKTKTIRRFLRGEYDVVACGGHIVDLPQGRLGIDIEHGFAPTVESITFRGRDKVESLRERLADADEVLLATDPDREGEAIAQDLLDHAVPEGVPVKRIEFNAIVFHAVTEALENPRDIHQGRVQAQRARRTLDRLIGFILSAHAKFDPEGPRCPAVGRVQSPAVALVVDREREIEAYEPRRYWTLHGRLMWQDVEFDVDLDGDVDAWDEAEGLRERLEAAGSMRVIRSEEDPEEELHPLPPYTTDSLQDDADLLLGFSPDRTMRIAQELYEGVDIDGSTRALITYMRTDSTRLSPTALNLAKRALAARPGYGEELYRGRTWQAQGAAQDAHEAIRPTEPQEPELFPENLEGKIEDDHLALYKLIYLRFLASQMVPAIYHRVDLEMEADGLEANAVGRELKSQGFLLAWREVRPDHGHKEVALPALPAGTTAELVRAWPEPRETRGPGRFREGSLVRELKQRGIGRPSTYSAVLGKIKRGRGGFGYVRKTRGRLRPTDSGEALVSYLRHRFDPVVDYPYTAHMEEALDRIESGELTYEDFLAEEWRWLEEPFRVATERGWMSTKRPTPAQVAYLDRLAEEAGTEVPEAVYGHKAKVSRWIDKLQEEMGLRLVLTPVHEAEVGGVAVHRFQLLFNRSLPDEEYAFLKEKRMRYRAGAKGRPPAFQFQRQNRAAVEALWAELRARYEAPDGPVEGATLEVLDTVPDDEA